MRATNVLHKHHESLWKIWLWRTSGALEFEDCFREWSWNERKSSHNQQKRVLVLICVPGPCWLSQSTHRLLSNQFSSVTEHLIQQHSISLWVILWQDKQHFKTIPLVHTELQMYQMPEYYCCLISLPRVKGKLFGRGGSRLPVFWPAHSHSVPS